MARFFLSAALVWIAAWLPLGLWLGDADYVLTALSRGSGERQVYQGLLYTGLLLVFLDSWRRYSPTRPRWGKAHYFAIYFVQGFLASVVLRLMLSYAGWVTWNFSVSSWLHGLNLLLSCLVVAVVEEAVFRGFLLGHLVERLGWTKAVYLSSLIFALVHLFRPGTLLFRFCYGLGLVALAYLLACIAWRHNSILASAGFHAGVILLNLAMTISHFEQNIWSGWNSEPVSGLLSILLTLAFLFLWQRLGAKDSSFLGRSRAS